MYPGRVAQNILTEAPPTVQYIPCNVPRMGGDSTGRVAQNILTEAPPTVKRKAKEL